MNLAPPPVTKAGVTRHATRTHQLGRSREGRLHPPDRRNVHDAQLWRPDPERWLDDARNCLDLAFSHSRLFHPGRPVPEPVTVWLDKAFFRPEDSAFRIFLPGVDADPESNAGCQPARERSDRIPD